MKINWFTLIAQVINFLVLMWLLKRYLYKPILKAIDERENKIVVQLKDADAKKAEAEKERDEFDQKNKTFDKQKAEMMQKVISETNAEEQRLKEKARDEVSSLKTKLEKAVVEEQERRNHEISQKVEREVVAIARKTLTDLSSASLEEQSVNTFLQKISELPADEKKDFISALKPGNEPILVQSAFELSSKQQSDIQAVVSELLGAPCQFKFTIAPELISGIQLTTNGYKLSWNISEYINSLEKNISEGPKDNQKITSENK